MSKKDDNDSKVILLNDDKTSFDYAMFILTNLFGYDKKQALEIAHNIDRHGQWTVLECNQDEANDILEKLKTFNEVSGNDLQIKIAPMDTPDIKIKKTKTIGHAVTLSHKDYILTPIDNSKITHLIMSTMFSSEKLDNGEVVSLARNWMDDLLHGREILIKDFKDDPRGEQKAKALLTLLEYKAQSTPELNMMILSVKNPGHTLTEKPGLSMRNQTVEEDSEDRQMLEMIGGFVADIEGEYIKDIEERYGSTDNFLKTAPQNEVDEYFEVQKSLKDMDDINKKSGVKPKKLGF